MEITDVKAENYEVTVDVPLRDEVRTRRMPIVEITTDEGITGYGQTGDNWWYGVREMINREMAPLVEGQNPLETEKIWTDLEQKFNQRVQTGAWSSAVSAIDIALWDIKGKYFGEPVWRLLGGAQNPVPAYITFGLKTFDREQLAEIASQFVSEGHDKLKMKVAVNDAADPNEDAKRIAAVRDAVGDDVELMIDANVEFSFNTALELCNRIEQYDITWFEEPVYGNDAKLLKKLRESTRIPISAGQKEGNRFKHRELIEAGAIDISQPNVLYVGGYTEAKKVASLAHSYNLDLANGGGWPYQNMHLHAAVPNGWRVEFHYIHWKVCEEIYTELPQPADGYIELPETPGMGFEPDSNVIEEFRVE